MDYEYFEKLMKKFATEQYLDDEEYAYYKRWFMSSVFMSGYMKHITAKYKEKKSYRYMITFTLDPSKCPAENRDTYYMNVEEYIKGLARSRQYEATEWWQVREYTKKNMPHWHVHVVSNKSIKKDFFRYYQRIYGLVDVSKSRTEMSEYSINYMNKESDPIQII